MQIKRTNIVSTQINKLIRVCLMAVLVGSLQIGLVQDYCDYFCIDTIELLDMNMEKEAESENEKSDIDDFLHQFNESENTSDGNMNCLMYVSDRLSSSISTVLTPPPDRA